MKTKSFNDVFSKNLRYYFDLSGMTQAEFAKKLGVGTTSIYNWLNGVKTPRMDKVDSMCKLLGIHRENLIADNLARERGITSFTGNMNNRLKELRNELHLTQQKFADRLGVKQNTIAQYEMGRNDPSNAVIISICREFNVSEEWLKNGIGEMFIPLSLDSDIEENFKKRFISALSKLDEEGWIFIEKFMESVLEGRKK